VAAGLALLLAGCSLDGLLKSNEMPPNVSDPALTQTPQGAVAAYNGTVAEFRDAFGGGGSFVAETGLLSDELLKTQETSTLSNSLDRRLLPEEDQVPDGGLYARFNRVRALAGQAIGLMTRYVPEQPTLQAHTYALEGYAETFLAELYCSGIPLSTVDFAGDYTYRPGSSTAAVFTHARALFDTALTLAGDSTCFTHLAAVGKARALLALGDYAGAAAAVAAVPDAYRYQVSYTDANGLSANNFATLSAGHVWFATVADREGTNGLDYRTSGDPRTTVTQRGTYQVGGISFPIYHPNRYSDSTVDPTTLAVTLTGAGPIVLASGVEARLIEAEAALQAGDAGTWLAKLNALRTDGTYDTTATSPPDTLWHAGTGGVAGLGPLADPGTAAGRVDPLFRERAFWLFLTGHRQGDLRRLIRQYDRSDEQVYPVGAYPNGTFGEQYGSDVTVPIPTAERTLNPLFTGCISRDA
jgi:hypothetical protein